jgi:acyl-CoA reductase-like NAD-dependent aldehyde dehydrogenase
MASDRPSAAIADALPRHRELYYGGEWHRAHGGSAATGAVNLTMREPFGVCARIVAYNHPLMFTAAKMAAPLAAATNDTQLARVWELWSRAVKP